MVEREIKRMIEEKMRFCKQAGVKNQVSYKQLFPIRRKEMLIILINLNPRRYTERH